jgi:hypothetical protein
MMKMNKRLLEILAGKPDLMINFPEWMLPHSIIKEIRATENVAIAEIAGRDSVAAVVRACELRPIMAIVPTLAYTATEYGNWETPLEKVTLLRKNLKQKKIRVFDLVILGSPKFWWMLCGRYSTHLSGQFTSYSHCVGCHLYFHTIRIPVSRILRIKVIIGGERESHDGRIKINQVKVALDAYQSFLKKFNIELFLPLRNIKSGKEIEAIVGKEWDEGDQQLSCVLSKNYVEADGTVSLHEEAIIKYLREFAFEKAEEGIKPYLERIHSDE